MGNKDDKNALALFANYSNGVKTNRDAWCYNASKNTVAANMQRMITFYNSEVIRFANAFAQADKKTREAQVDGFVNTDPTKISWDRPQKGGVAKGRIGEYIGTRIVKSLYRPFTKNWLYFDNFFNNCVYQMPRIFPNATVENRVICVTGIGVRTGFSALIVDSSPNSHTLGNGQCFPLYLYEEVLTEVTDDLFGTGQKSQLVRKDAITAAGLAHWQAAYPEEKISPEDIFYYVYALLHCPDYRKRYADNLSKELPRIPRVATAALFWQLSQAGRSLADLHINYETVAMYPAQINGQQLKQALTNSSHYRVEKMRYGKLSKAKDLTTIHYNDTITISGIPTEAYEYVVNGKPAIDWVVERQGVRTDKDSGIVNDANTWAMETMHNPRYPLELLLRVITVSVETMGIVKGLPKI